MFYSPHYSGQDSGVSWLGRVKQRTKEQYIEHFNKWDSLFAFLFFCTCFICSLLNSRTFLENSGEEGKTAGFSDGLLPALFLALCACLSFSLSLCISMPWKFREAIVYQTEAWPIPAQRENVSSVFCVILHSKICCGKLATKQNNIVGWNEKEKDRAAVRSKVNRNTCWSSSRVYICVDACIASSEN